MDIPSIVVLLSSAILILLFVYELSYLVHQKDSNNKSDISKVV